MRPSWGLPKNQLEHMRREDKTRTRDEKAISSGSFREPQRGQTPNRGQLMIPIRVRFDPPQVGEPDPTMQSRKEPLMRRMKITESMLQKYGYTEGCVGCQGQSCRHDSEALRRSLSETNSVVRTRSMRTRGSRKRWRGIEAKRAINPWRKNLRSN